MRRQTPYVQILPWESWQQHIRELRSLAWSHDLECSAPPALLISDCLDARSSYHHFGLQEDGLLVGTLRASIHGQFSDIPFSKYFENRRPECKCCASTSRLVVHPAYRGLGYARELESFALDWVRQQLVEETFGMVRSDRARVAALQRQGYSIIEETESEWYDGSMRETWLLSCRF